MTCARKGRQGRAEEAEKEEEGGEGEEEGAGCGIKKQNLTKGVRKKKIRLCADIKKPKVHTLRVVRPRPQVLTPALSISGYDC